MINRSTVLILGAGASCAYGLPIGERLSQLISELSVERLAEIPTGTEAYRNDKESAIAFKKAFNRAQVNSIDAFLGHRPNFADIGRYAIAKCLLPLEDISRLRKPNGFNEAPPDHWYRILFNAMATEKPEDFGKNRVAFITFNYDRSLECAMADMLEHRYGIDNAQAIALVAEFSIVHVYGKLGSHNPTADDFVPYAGGGEISRQSIMRAALGIQVIPEGRHDSPEFDTARELIRDASKLCFLGFGFDDTNVDRLGGVEICSRVTSQKDTLPLEDSFAASVLGLTKMEVIDAMGRICTHGEIRNYAHDANCSMTLRNSLILRQVNRR